jgi:hypothetical protein
MNQADTQALGEVCAPGGELGTTPDSGASRPRISPVRIAGALCWVWVVGLLSVGVWASYWAALRDDHYQLIHLGQCILNGGTLYVDCWENKPPGIAWLNALALAVAGGNPIGAWIAPALVAWAALAWVAGAVRRVFGRLAALGTLLVAGVLMSLRVHDAPSINPDFYCAALGLAAVASFVVALNTRIGRRHGVWGLAAGLLWAGAACFKQTGPIGLAAMTAVGLIVGLTDPANRRAWFRAVGWGWLGLALGIAAVVLALYLRGALTEAYQAVFVFSLRYAQPGDWLEGLADWRRAVAGHQPIQFAVWLAALGLVASLSSRGLRSLPRPLAVALAIWWLAEVVLALMGPSRSMRYWQAVSPPLLMLGAGAWRYLQMSVRRVGAGNRAGLVLVVVTAVALLGAPTWRHYTYGLADSYIQFSADVRQRDQLRELSRSLQELVPKGDAIFVLNYDPGVYVYSKRSCACRFTYPRSSRQTAELLRCLESGRAAAILQPRGPSMLFDAYFDRPAGERLKALLESYRRVGPLTGGARYDVFLRRSP